MFLVFGAEFKEEFWFAMRPTSWFTAVVDTDSLHQCQHDATRQEKKPVCSGGQTRVRCFRREESEDSFLSKVDLIFALEQILRTGAQKLQKKGFVELLTFLDVMNKR